VVGVAPVVPSELDTSPGLTVAMHMSDGLVNAPTAAVFGLVAAVGLAIAANRAQVDLDERTAPMAGLVTAFVFAVQMINFPILPGASGHLLGGALVAILVGPWVGSLCIAIVLVVQALLFADGGLTALGTNITNMALVGVFTGYGVAYALRRVAARSRGGLLAVAFVAALVNTVVAALAFVAEYAVGGSGAAGLGTVFALMAGLHVLVGIGEGIITAATVGAVASTRPDLVHLLRGTRPAVAEGMAR
jgi:cobalt/nickel transport system permease protein